MKVLNSYGITKKENGVENVRNSKVSQEEDKLIQQKLQEAFGYTDEQLAPSWIKPPPNTPLTQN